MGEGLKPEGRSCIIFSKRILLRQERYHINKIEKIGREIKKLTPSELVAFRKWFYEFDAEVWDRQIEEEVKAGKLDVLAEKALSFFTRSESCT